MVVVAVPAVCRPSVIIVTSSPLLLQSERASERVSPSVSHRSSCLHPPRRRLSAAANSLRTDRGVILLRPSSVRPSVLSLFPLSQSSPSFAIVVIATAADAAAAARPQKKSGSLVQTSESDSGLAYVECGGTEGRKEGRKDVTIGGRARARACGHHTGRAVDVVICLNGGGVRTRESIARQERRSLWRRRGGSCESNGSDRAREREGLAE